VEKQMEIDQLKADTQILHSAVARLRSGSALLCRKPVIVEDDADGPQSFDPPTNSTNLLADDESDKVARAMSLLDGTLVHIERCFDAIATTTKSLLSRQDFLPSRSRLYALDLATTFDHGPVVPPAFADAFQSLSDILLRAQSHVAKQKQCVQSLHMDSLPMLVKDYEEQLDTLLADLQAANKALFEKDQVLEKMHDISSRHEAERRQLDHTVAELQERVQLQEQSTKVDGDRECATTSHHANEKTKCEDEDESSPTVACQRAAAHLLLHAIDKRALTAKSVAFRQWACHASAQQAVARQQHIAAILSDQLQETQEKLKRLKKHMKKSRSSRGAAAGGGGGSHPQLGTIAETSRDDDDDETSSAAVVS
jgi:hypothetical protein